MCKSATTTNTSLRSYAERRPEIISPVAIYFSVVMR